MMKVSTILYRFLQDSIQLTIINLLYRASFEKNRLELDLNSSINSRKKDSRHSLKPMMRSMIREKEIV